jgi:mannose-6-phosphate isomerase-like protein (cupin superfamily)
MEKVNLRERLDGVDEHWRPGVVGAFNGQEMKVVKFAGEFVWHHHDETDEVFLVWRGSFEMHFRDRVVELREGDMIVVPRGVEHRPVASDEVEVLLFEACGTRNTGNVVDELLTAPG